MGLHAAATRYYVHGDLHDRQRHKYYCARCDLFVPIDHFADAGHVKSRAERYLHSLNAWSRHAQARHSKFYRPADAENVIAALAAEDVKAEKAARSPFFRWLLRQLKRDDPIGDFARDAESDRSFPRTNNSLDGLKSHLFRLNASPEAFVALDEGWAEFKAKGKTRAGLSAAVRFVIFKRDSYRCQLCGATASDGRRLEIDHKVAIANGGSNDAANLWTLCFECNRGKGVHDL
jgi:uncharacterized protein YozE (UPF0346 family)